MDLPVGNKLIPYNTPYHVVELFLQLLKHTFSDLPEDYPFRFDNEDYTKSKILFDTAYNKESKIIGKPIVIVSRGGQSNNVNIIGDFATKLPSIGGVEKQFGTNLVQSSLNIRIISKLFAEVEILSQHIYGFLLTCRTILDQLLGVHMVLDTSLSEVSRYDQDVELYTTQCIFSYVMQAKWIDWREVDILKGINFSINKKSN